ncbi:MAG: DNA-directed RNA polymerase subunit delta [Bacilli bacterium]|nr:DNA-directed RNA polymerase subunit delta [Bacilli bacterium]
MPKSLIDYAFDYLDSNANPVSFADMWAYIKETAGLTEEVAAAKVSRLYTNLMLDGRFVTLGENMWDLRVRHTFDKVHIDMKDVYSDVESSDDDLEDAEEDKEYNEVFEEKELNEADDDAALAPETTDPEEDETL